VRAESQARLLERITPFLDEEERLVVRRGRNVQGHRVRKGAGKDFSSSTGLEALLGYLIVREDFQRIETLLRNGEEDNPSQPLNS
jgi:ribonuclease-3 family protein